MADKLVTCPRIKGTAQNEWPIRKIAGNRKPQQDIMVGGWTPVDSKRDHYVWKRGVQEVEFSDHLLWNNGRNRSCR